MINKYYKLLKKTNQEYLKKTISSSQEQVNKTFEAALILFLNCLVLTVKIIIILWSYNEVVPTMISGEKITLIDSFALITLVSTISSFITIDTRRKKIEL